MSPRQWHGLRAWLGEPEQFQDPEYDRIGARFRATQELGALKAALFADQTMADLVAAGQSYGVPIAAVLAPAEVLAAPDGLKSAELGGAADHFNSVGALAQATIGSNEITVPAGPFVFDGVRSGLRWAAPDPGAHPAEWRPRSEPVTGNDGSVRPFDGLRILDLGIIVAGGELGRQFADLGAEVIKVESAVYPDGLRQTRKGQPMGEAFAWTHRNEVGLGLDLRHPDGAKIFSRLVAGADAIFANFKPGTLASLGFPYEKLRDLNPRIVLAESSAFGEQGPWSNQLGYGPLVRAATGITRLWTAEDAPDDGRPPFVDAVTVFPDHVSARVTAIAALAAIVRRYRTGVGAHVHISQSEVGINQLDTRLVADAAAARNLPVSGDARMHSVHPCAGEDEWCVISVRDDEDWRALTAVIGHPELRRGDSGASAVVSAWTSARDKSEVAAELQEAGIPAAPMNRPAEVLVNPQIQHRELYADMVHPLFDVVLPAETGPAPYRRIPRAELRPAPQPGEHTREICHKVLGLDADEIDRLLADSALFTSTEQTSPERRSSS